MAQAKNADVSDPEYVPLLPSQAHQGSGEDITPDITQNLSSDQKRKHGYVEYVCDDFGDHIDKDPLTKELLDAIECDNEDEVLRLLDAGADPNGTYPLTPRQQQYLYTAVWDDDREGYKKVATWKGTPVWSMLQFASARCNTGAARALLARGDVAGAAFYHGHCIHPDQFLRTVSLLAAAGAAARARGAARSALHTAARLRSAGAARLLLQAGATARTDSDGYTPMHICVEDRCEDVLETLLELCRGAAQARDRGGRSLLSACAAAGWGAGAAAALRAGADAAALCPHPEKVDWQTNKPVETTPLHLAVERNDIDIVDNILTLAKQKNVNCRNSCKATPLATAIECGHLACVRLLLRHGASLTNIDRKQSNALHLAAFFSYPNGVGILKYLLDNADVSDLINSPDGWHHGPIHRAVIAGPEPVKILLDKGADVRLKIGGEDNNFGRWFTPLHFAAVAKNADTARIILGYDRTTIEDIDAMGRTPLVVAVLNKSQDVLRAIVRAGGLLSSYPKGIEKQSAVEMITDKLPNPTGFFEQVFDSFLYRVGASGSSDAVINYEILANDCERNQLKLIEELVRCGQSKVLVHPLMETYLYLKWRNLLPIFYFLLGTYAFFVLTLNIFVASAFYYGDRKEDMSDVLNKFLLVDVVFLYASICILILQESICMHARGRRYWYTLETWIKVASLLFAAGMPPALLAGPAQPPGAAARLAGSAALLLAWLQIMFLLSRFPNWGYYVLMIGKVLLTSVFLVVAFALCFMIQFKVTAPFDGPLAAFTKTIVMLSSEFGYEDLYGADHDSVLSDSRTVVRLLLVIFLIFVSLVLMNFIIGIAVNDINDLTVTGNVRRLEKQLELLTTLDALVCDGILGKILPGSTVSSINRRFISKIIVNPGTTKTWTVHCENLDYNYQIELPSHLYQAIVVKSWRMDTTEFYNKQLRNTVAMLSKAIITDDCDPSSFRDYLGVRVKSKFNDIFEKLKTLDDVQQDMKKFKSFCYNEHAISRDNSVSVKKN